MFSVGFIVFLLLVFLLILPFVKRIVYSGNIGQLPDLSGYSNSLSKYINETYQAASEEPNSSEKVGKLAMVYHSNFFYNEAEICYNAAIEIDGDEWLWYYYLALIKEELGDSKKSIDNLTQVVAINPSVSIAWFKIGNSYFKQNSLTDAENAFNKVLESDNFKFGDSSFPVKGFPITAYAKLNLNRIYIQQNENDKARINLHNLIEDFPRFGPAYRSLGQLYFSIDSLELGEEYLTIAGDFDSYQPPADPMLNELILLSKNNAFILKQIDIALKNDNPDWAEILCRHILSYDPKDMEAVGKYILVSLVKSDFTKLEENLKSYYNYYHDNSAKLLIIGETLNRWNQVQFSLIYAKRAAAVDPGDAEAQALYLRLLAKTDFNESILHECEKALRAVPENSEIRTEYARILALLGREKEAKSQFDLALKLNPNNDEALILLGIMAEEEGNTQDALNYYKRSIKANPLNVNTILRYGNYLLELKRWGEAFQLFEKSLEDSPNNIDLLERYAWILAVVPDSSIRDGKRALQLAKRIALIRKNNAAQDIRCGITLAAAYAETGKYENSIMILQNLLGRAKETRSENFIPEIQELASLFKSSTPFRLME